MHTNDSLEHQLFGLVKNLDETMHDRTASHQTDSETFPYKEFQFTKDENGVIEYYDMMGRSIPPPPADLLIRVVDHDPRILPQKFISKGKTGSRAISSLTRNRVVIR